MSVGLQATTTLAKCPKCKHAISGLIVVKGVLKTINGGTEIGSAKCGECGYMLHWGKQANKPLKKR